MIEELAPLAEDAAQGLGHRKDELPVRQLKAEDAGDPVAGLTDFPLMTARAEVAGFAGEGEGALMPAIGALEPGEVCGKVTATVELTHDGYGDVAEWTVDGAVAGFVAGFEIGPVVMDELPQR